MNRFAQYLEIALGVFFLFSAGAKAMNIEGFAVSISAYGVIKAPVLVNFAAYVTLFLETAIGASLAAGRTFKGLTHAAAIGLTVVFTGLILYAWQVKGLEDCGCFGDYVKMGPAASILKNIVLVGLLAAAWAGNRVGYAEPLAPLKAWRAGLAAIGIIAVAGIALTQNRPDPARTATIRAGTAPSEGAFANYAFETEAGTVDLGDGEYLAALLSATCSHCMDSVPLLNELNAAEDLPDVLGLMLGQPNEIHDFEFLTEPNFPLFGIPSLQFMEHIDTAPPRLVHVRDGEALTAWEWQDAGPAIEEVRQAVSGGS